MTWNPLANRRDLIELICEMVSFCASVNLSSVQKSTFPAHYKETKVTEESRGHTLLMSWLPPI